MKLLQQLQPLQEIHKNSIEERLDETSVIRSLDQLRKYTARDIADFAFMHFLVLFILSNHLHEAPVVKGHAARTLTHGNFKRFTFAATDLYMYLHLLLGYDSDKLKKDRGNAVFFSRCHMREVDLKGMLRDMANGQRNLAKERRFLLYLEKHLQIETANYRSCRRLVSYWNDQETRNQRLVVTRLLLAMRTRCPTSDMLVHLERYAKAKRFEIKDVANPELLSEDIINELFTASPVEWSTKANSFMRGEFEVNGIPYVFKADCDPGTNNWSVVYMYAKAYSNPYQPAGDQPKDKFKVLSKVVSYVVKLIEEREPDEIRFSGIKEDNLDTLYAGMIKNLKKVISGYGYETEQQGDKFYLFKPENEGAK